MIKSMLNKTNVCLFFLLIFSCKKEEYRVEVVELETKLTYKMVNEKNITQPLQSYYVYIVKFTKDWSSGNSIYTYNVVFKDKCAIDIEGTGEFKLPQIIENKRYKSDNSLPYLYQSFITFSRDSSLDQNGTYLFSKNQTNFKFMVNTGIIKPGGVNNIIGKFIN